VIGAALISALKSAANRVQENYSTKVLPAENGPLVSASSNPPTPPCGAFNAPTLGAVR
jgi:hypothetical protein